MRIRVTLQSGAEVIFNANEFTYDTTPAPDGNGLKSWHMKHGGHRWLRWRNRDRLVWLDPRKIDAIVRIK